MSTSISLKSADKKEQQAVFLIKNTTAGFVNSIRRAILEFVPVMAVEEVEISKNSCTLYDEVIAHRLGLMPLTTDLKSYVPKDKCACQGAGCAKCQVKLTLAAKGEGYVLAESMKSKDPAIVPAFPKMPIAKLIKGQEIELEATASLGYGKDHVKWCSAHVWHTRVPKLTISKNQSLIDEWKEKYPPQVFKDRKIDEKAIEELNLYDAVDGVNDDIIKVDYEPDQFLLFVESFGQLKVKEIMQKALETLKFRFEELEASLKE